MKSLIKRLWRRKSTLSPLISITVSKSALIHNLNEFRRVAPGNSVVPVLKSNAYGHGLTLVAKALEKETFPFFVVDSHFEAKALRNEGIKKPILIIGYSTIETIMWNELQNIYFTITSLDALKELSEEIKGNKVQPGKKIIIHLKLDTGMHRQGILPEELDESLLLVKNDGLITLEGICSHLADADSADVSFTKGQIAVWNSLTKKARENFSSVKSPLKYFHISATAGHEFSPLNRCKPFAFRHRAFWNKPGSGN